MVTVHQVGPSPSRRDNGWSRASGTSVVSVSHEGLARRWTVDHRSSGTLGARGSGLVLHQSGQVWRHNAPARLFQVRSGIRFTRGVTRGVTHVSDPKVLGLISIARMIDEQNRASGKGKGKARRQTGIMGGLYMGLYVGAHDPELAKALVAHGDANTDGGVSSLGDASLKALKLVHDIIGTGEPPDTDEAVRRLQVATAAMETDA